MILLKAALEYAGRGWRVVPQHWVTEDKRCSCGNTGCKRIAKHEIPDGGAKNASKSQAVIAKWWGEFPEANIGIASGSQSGLVVIDIDPRHGGDKSFQSLIRTHGPIPHTIEVITGGGGRHYYFEAPKFEVRGRIGMLPGIDVRAQDQIFTAPPSKHVSGMRYEFDEKHHPDNNAPAPLPRWLLHRILTKNPPKKRIRRPFW